MHNSYIPAEEGVGAGDAEAHEALKGRAAPDAVLEGPAALRPGRLLHRVLALGVLLYDIKLNI